MNRREFMLASPRPRCSPRRKLAPSHGSTAPCAGRNSRSSKTTRASTIRQLLARLLPPHPLRCRLPQRRRLRRLLSHQRSRCTTAASGWAIAIRSANWSTGCRKLGMDVIARTDPHAAHQDVYEAHPDWIAVDAEGKKRRHWADARVVGHLRARPLQFRVHDRGDRRDRRAVSRWTASSATAGRAPACATASTARRISTTASGLDLPRTDDPQDPARRAYIVWRQQRLFELWRLWDAEDPKASIPARALHPQRRRRRAQRSGHEDDRRARAHSVRRPPGAQRPDAALGQRQERQGVSRHHGPQSRSAASSAWASRSRTAGKIRCRAAPRSGSGCSTASPTDLRPWFTKFTGKPYDRRWLPVVEELYDWHYRNERYLRNEEPLARVAMVYSQQTATFYGGDQARQQGRRPRARLLPGAGRSAHPVRDGARPAARRRAHRPVQGADPAQHRRALRPRNASSSASSSSAAAASSPPTRLRSMTNGACAAQRFRARRSVRRFLRRHGRRRACRTRI